MQALTASPSNLEKPKDSEIKSQTVTSAPPQSVSGSKQNVNGENVRRTNSSTETKIRCTIPSERLIQLRKSVDEAIRDHKTFTVKGNC